MAPEMAARFSQFVWNLKSFYYRWLRRFFAYKWIYARELKPFRTWLNGRFSKNGLYLDLAAGSGDSLVLFPPGISVVAVDFSLAMLALLRKKRPIPIVQARAEALPFKSGAFSGITAIGLAEYLPLPGPFLEEVRHALAEDGWLAFTFSQRNLVNFFRNLTGNPIHFHSLNDFSEEARRLGFDVLHVHKTLFQTQVFLLKKEILRPPSADSE